MTEAEKKVFVNWTDDDFGTVEHVIVTGDGRDAAAISKVTNVPVICRGGGACPKESCPFP